MAFKRPTPKKLSSEQFENIVEASARQTTSTSKLKSYDPNFPAFEVPVNQKLLVYIPNHTVTGADGSENIRMDKFAAHSTQVGRSFGVVRCNSGIVAPELGLDGSCPFCDAIGETWDLYNKELSGIAAAKGINLEDPNSKELLKNDVINLLNKRAVKAPEIYYTFPIVVIDCEKDADGNLTTTPKKDADGRISGKAYWYTINERTYQEKWGKAFETAPTPDDVPPTHPAGLWAVLNYTYTPKSGSHTKMGSAKSLAVGFKSMSEAYNQWAEYFDKLTEEWTPVKAMETLVNNALRDAKEQQEACDEVMSGTRERLAMLDKIASGAMPAGNTDAEATLAAFGATSVEAPAAPAAIPQAVTDDIPQVGVQG